MSKEQKKMYDKAVDKQKALVPKVEKSHTTRLLEQLDEPKIPFEDIYDKYFDLTDLELSDVSDIESPNVSNNLNNN